MTDWPEYESHKVVRAAKIVRVIRDGHNPGAILRCFVDPGDGPVEFFPTHADMLQEARDGGYAVIYEDGFKSISPAKAFEEGYTRKEPSAAELGAAVRRGGLAGS